MISTTAKRLIIGVFFLFFLWFAIQYLLPIFLPFLLGGLVALAAEPLVSFFQRRLRLGRALSAGIGVSITLLLLMGLVSMLGALLLRELIQLASSLPDLEQTTHQGISLLQNWAVTLSDKAPSAVQPMLTRTVENAFQNGTALMDEAVRKIPKFIAAILSGLPDGLLKAGTGLLAAFMISARLPKLREGIKKRIPRRWKETYFPAVSRVKESVGGWLKAQGILALITYGIVSLGLTVLGVPYGFFWALLIALMDAVPMLGTGLVMIPWAIVSLLQDRPLRALGMVGIFLAATITRSTLEPKLVGKQLGLDPLSTLLALYTGYYLWGFLGLLAAPILTAAVKSALRDTQ